MSKQSHKHYGLAVYEVDGEEWAVGTEAQAQKAAETYVADTLWAFNADYLINYMPNGMTSEAVMAIQESLSEGANDAILALVGAKKKKLIKDAIASDGRGHMLAGYDGREWDSDDIEGLPRGKVAYRIN